MYRTGHVELLLWARLKKSLPSRGGLYVASGWCCGHQGGRQKKAEDSRREGRHYICRFGFLVVFVLFRVRIRLTCILQWRNTYTPALFILPGQRPPQLDTLLDFARKYPNTPNMALVQNTRFRHSCGIPYLLPG